jgi:hypothetical protein
MRDFSVFEGLAWPLPLYVWMSRLYGSSNGPACSWFTPQKEGKTMRKLVRPVVTAVIAATVLLAGTLVSEAQDQQPGGEPGRRPRGELRGEGERGRGFRGGPRGQMDPAQMREMMAQRLKEGLGCTDEELEVIGPRVQKVVEAQAGARMRRFMGMGGFRGPGAQSDPEADALSKAIESEDTPKADIEPKLKAYRDAVKKKEAALKKTREELREVVTLRQEAGLVLMGILD